jgi:hypothetical protein
VGEQFPSRPRRRTCKRGIFCQGRCDPFNTAPGNVRVGACCWIERDDISGFNPFTWKRPLATPYVSVHFPKAGGFSLKIQLERMLGQSLLLDYTHDPLGPHAMEEVDELPPGCEMVHGHFRASRYSKLKNRFLFTFLRNPIDNLFSIYFFWRDYMNKDNPWHEKFMVEKPSIVEFAKYGPLQRLMSDSYFGGFDVTSFDFVGFHETRRDDYLKLGCLINLPLSGEIHTNRTEGGQEERAKLMSSQKIMCELVDLLADDLNFYYSLFAERK